jgi:signal transduction histidine kinase
VPLFMLLYCHRYMGLQRRKLELFMVGYTAVCTVLMGAYMGAWLGKDTLALIWLPFSIGTSVYMLTVLWRLLRHSVGATPFMLALALAFFLVGELHDRMISTATLEPWIGFDAAYWRPVSAMLLALAFCLLVADEFVRAINDAKQSAVAQERALAAERARMNREMHDGLGAQLITALRGVERGAFNKEQVAQLLQDGLDELRLLMDASDFSRSLHGALAAWRNQWDARLGAMGITLRWHIDPALEHLSLTADITLHVMRVLQEAVTNAVKHGKASAIEVTAHRATEPALLLTVQDDGCGIALEPTGAARPRGRGLVNMQQRATQMGASLQVQALTAPLHGTRVSLSLPLV